MREEKERQRGGREKKFVEMISFRLFGREERNQFYPAK